MLRRACDGVHVVPTLHACMCVHILWVPLSMRLGALRFAPTSSARPATTSQMCHQRRPWRRWRLVAALASALWLALLHLALRLSWSANGRAATAPPHGAVTGSSCRLACTLGGAAEPGLVHERPSVVTLPAGTELLLHQPRQRPPASGVGGGHREHRCTLERGGLLQLPRGLGRLARTTTPRGRVWLIPEGALLRLPLPEPQGGLANASSAAATCESGGRAEARTAERDDLDERERRASLYRLATRLHARCTLSVGTMVDVRAAAATLPPPPPLAREQQRRPQQPTTGSSTRPGRTEWAPDADLEEVNAACIDGGGLLLRRSGVGGGGGAGVDAAGWWHRRSDGGEAKVLQVRLRVKSATGACACCLKPRTAPNPVLPQTPYCLKPPTYPLHLPDRTYLVPY